MVPRVAPGPSHPIIVLWAVPRSASTAFERMMIERGDHTVFDEPFSVAYYFGPDRMSARFEETMPTTTWSSVTADLISAARLGPVFVKDMSYHVGPVLSAELMGNFTNSFLIRDPRSVAASMAKKWPDVTEDELGFHSLGRAYDLACAAAPGAEPPPVINTHDLLADPSGVIGAWCDAVGIAIRPDALGWEPGLQPQWQHWPDWYDGVVESTGFAAPRPGPAPTIDDPRLARLCEEAAPIYQRLAAASIGR